MPMRRALPRRIATLFIVLKDGTKERVGMRSLRIARAAAHTLNSGGNYRCVFAMMR
jgi:hypothetical protein